MFKKEEFFIVTGSSSGIGKEIGISLIKEGASVIAIGRNKKALEEIKNNIKSDNFYYVIFDLTEVSKIEALVNDLVKSFGKLTGLVNCAGISKILPLRSIDSTIYTDIFLTNYYAQIELTRCFTSYKNLTRINNSVVFISSLSAVYGHKGTTLYAGSKGAIVSSAKAMASELLNKVRVNVISPGFIDTPLLTENSRKLGNEYPLGIGSPKDVADLTLFLLSSKAKWITGQNYIMDGGRLL